MYFNETKMAKLAINKSLLKEYRTNECARVVYMDNDTDFEIQLFNPESRVIGAEISVNGETMPGYLVLQPGERVWLERYTGKSMKLRFSTYEVEDTVEVKNAIADNGKVRVRFFRVKPMSSASIVYYNNSDNDYYTNFAKRISTNPYVNTYEFTTVSTSSTAPYGVTSTTADTCATSIANSMFSDTCDAIQTSVTNAFLKTEITSASNDSFGFASYGCDMKCSEPSPNSQRARSKTRKKTITSFGNAQPNTMETGRISEGGYSDQSFKNVHYDFEYSPFAVEDMMILPSSRKQISSGDLKKVYCTQCGRKLSSKFKYCPYCGAKCV